MKRLIGFVLLVLMVVSSGCAIFDHWTDSEKVEYGIYVIGTTIDGIQTHKSFRYPDKYREVNPLTKNDSSMITFKALTLFIPFILSDKNREPILIIGDVMMWGIVIRNDQTLHK